jgi:hypothetical protein
MCAGGFLCAGETAAQPARDSISGERIWIEVTGRVGNKYIGKLGNTPVIIAGKYGDRVYFRAEHVIDIMRSGEGGAK